METLILNSFPNKNHPFIMFNSKEIQIRLCHGFMFAMYNLLTLRVHVSTHLQGEPKSQCRKPQKVWPEDEYWDALEMSENYT